MATPGDVEQHRGADREFYEQASKLDPNDGQNL